MDPEAGEYLLAGDKTAIPAIAGILAEYPTPPPPAGLRWHPVEVIHRDPGTALWDSLMAERAPAEHAKVWGAAERGFSDKPRKHAQAAWNLPLSRVHVTTYRTADRARV